MANNFNDGGPAFPSLNPTFTGISSDGEERWETEPHGGMTLRDYFAATASDQDVSFQGEILREQISRSKGIGVLPDYWRATARFMHADAMLAARKQGEN